MNVATGTSGFSYKEWKGAFYPDDLSPPKMLAFYATKLAAVEINNTFYRMPRASVLESWSAQVPASFRFILKASRRITHFKRLRDVGEEVGYLAEVASGLGPRLGAILYQLPPNFPVDPDRLGAFLSVLPASIRAAMEFRHPSWMDEQVFALLRSSNVALCTADVDDSEHPDIVSTADWGYLRLRRVSYEQSDLDRWAADIHAQTWSDAFVFFKHEDAASGPNLAVEFAEMCNH